ncbi:methyltransferase family protein [Scopulibacillus darangshiensis]|uniref:Methyltransferase family protein n=1 Tax=Scopulibacillus darangshiensis TaxID=442528 RepID=A0A4R2P9T7_9BACL|nr:class I SAM-dependent methyltransferase [Scopulibacillus darangshiensis]TCP31803.1 methyltransferase family protein [Scopulibacillus darangshiensis]
MPDYGDRFNPEHADKLLSSKRLKELPPDNILALLDLKKGDIAADFGSGNGFFTVPMAKITQSTVYAVDIEPKMHDLLKAHAEEKDVDTITFVTAELGDTTLGTHSVDKLFSSFVMHEVPDLHAVMSEMRRVTKPGGTIVILDWEAVPSESGPPIGKRIPSDKMETLFAKEGFAVKPRMINDAVYALIVTNVANQN